MGLASSARFDAGGSLPKGTAKATVLPTEPTTDFPYKLTKIAGNGSSGIVYRAVETNLNREVAIKILKPKHSVQLRDRFIQEARAAASLHHPGVVTIYRIDTYKDVHYMVMEWIDGSTLNRFVKANAPSAQRAAAMTIELLDVLEAAHKSGIIHRDIKPSNLMLTANGKLKVTDFGIARLLENSLVETMVGTVLATPKFASPEQLSGKTVDHRSDLFSAAMVFYYLLTGGSAPFEANSVANTMTRILTARHVPITKLKKDLPAKFDLFFKKALQKRPCDRFQNAVEMKHAIQNLLETKPFTTPPKHVFRTRNETPGSTLKRFVASWPEREIDVDDMKVALDKLLISPLHAPPFRGVAIVDNQMIFIDNGTVVSAIHCDTGRPLRDIELPRAGMLKIRLAPKGYRHLFSQLAALPAVACDASHISIKADVINLISLFEDLKANAFTGSVYLGNDEGYGLDVFQGGSNHALFLGGKWAEQSVEQDFTRWLKGVKAQVSLIDNKRTQDGAAVRIAPAQVHSGP